MRARRGRLPDREKEAARKWLKANGFDVARYAGCGQLDAAGWVVQLGHRELVRDVCKRGRYLGTTPKKELIGLIAKPLLAAKSELVSASRDVLDKIDAVLLRSCVRDPDDRDRKLKTLRTVCSMQVIVDLAAPDELLQEEFAAWLAMRRSLIASSRRRRITRAELQRWASNQILAFVDLRLAADHYRVTLTDELLGNALFSDDATGGVVERVRKTVRPLAMLS